MTSSEQKAVVVTRKTRLEELIERFNTLGQAKFYITHSFEHQAISHGKSAAEAQEEAKAEFASYEEEHFQYHNSLTQLKASLDGRIKFQIIERSFLPNFLFAPQDIVIPIGQDGLVANTAKYAMNHAIIAINPDPMRFDGVLLPFTVKEVADVLDRTLTGKARIQTVSLAEAKLNDGQRLIAFNDFFVGSKTHISARYRIEIDKASEVQSSSGVLISTGAGSTGWLSSVFNMAGGLQRYFGMEKITRKSVPWDSPSLFYVVREPFISKMSNAEIVAGLIDSSFPLTIESQMPTNGVIFSDGVESDYLVFNSGAIAHIGIAKEKAHLITG